MNQAQSTKCRKAIKVVLGVRGKSGKAVNIDDNVSGKRAAWSRRKIDKTDLNDDNRTAQKNKTEETEEGLEQLNASLDAEAIKQIVLNNARTLDVEQWTKAKAMACWNQLARDLTMRFTDNKHQGFTIEEEEKSKQMKLNYRDIAPRQRIKQTVKKD
jgi:hypothetical protein